MLALCLVVAALSGGACGRNPTSFREDRPLAVFQPYLTRQLTPASARAQFGAPDEETGSGLLIYKYRVEGGRTLWLGFPGFAAITYARLEAKDGTLTDLALP
jgi:hypothetical protein